MPLNMKTMISDKPRTESIYNVQCTMNQFAMFNVQCTMNDYSGSEPEFDYIFIIKWYGNTFRAIFYFDKKS